MRKLKRVLSLLLTSCIFMSLGGNLITKAETREDIAKLEIKVNGNGTVIVDDGEAKYSLKDKETLRANVTVNSKLKLTVTPDSGYSILEVNGIDSVTSQNGNSKTYEVNTKANGTFIGVKFVKEVKEETKSEIKEENNIVSEKVEDNLNNIEDVVLTEEEKREIEIINKYIEGIKMLPEMIEARKNKAEELNLLNLVDENYFLVDDFYKDKSEADVENLGANILVNTVTNEELNNWAKALKYSLLKNTDLDLKTVTFYQMVSYGQSIVGKFEVDGRMAFCSQHSRPTPAKGAPTGTPRLINNDMMRKALYYGYGGPGQLSNMTGNYGWVVTSLALSRANGDKGGNLANDFYNQISNMPTPPTGFKVYVVSTNSGSTQDLAYWEYSPKGTLQISKSSADPSITNGNNCYDITGAEYGVFTNSNATGQVATLKIDANGWSQEIELDEGTYFIKEIKNPKGFALDNNVYSVSVSAGNKTTKNFTDRPQADPIGILIRKVDADTGANRPQGSGSLADSHFTIKYYAGEYQEDVNPADLGVNPTRTWVLKTDNDGFTYLSDSYKVSGDPFYYNSTSAPTIPLGTITIEETKAPIGYKLNREIFVRKIVSNGYAENITTYVEPIVREDVLEFKIKKVQAGTSIVIPNVKFKHTKPDGSSEELTTNSNGEIIIKGLVQGTHKIIEIKSADGYELNKNEFVFEVKTDNTIKVVSNTTNMGMVYSENNGDGLLTVNNNVAPFSIKIIKINDKGNALAGAEFGLFSDKACTNKIDTQTTDGKGNLKFNNLKVGEKYYVKETKYPTGYPILGEAHIYEIQVEATPINNVFDYIVDGVKYTIKDTNSKNDIYLSGGKSDRELNIKVVNNIGMELPKTGSVLMLPILFIGIGLMSYSLFSRNKIKNDKGE